MTGTPLRESQAVAILWALEHPRSGLFLPMGFGKTRLVIEALDFLDWPRTLVVAPKRVAEDVWTSELPRWAPGVRFSLVAGPPQKRLDALATPAQVYIISRDNLAWLVNDGLKKLRRMLHQKRTPHYEAIIIDELSSFKSRESNRFKALNALTNNASTPADVVWGLTGTPASDSLLDLWPEMYILDKGESLGTSITAFRDKFFEPDNPYKLYPKMVPKDGAEQKIYELMKANCLSMSDSVMEGLIPDITHNRINVNLPHSLLEGPKSYASFMEHAVYGVLGYETVQQKDGTLLKKAVLADWAIPTTGVAALRAKALQYTAGFIYREDHSVEQIHTAKLDTTQEIVENLNGDPLLIFYRFREERDALMKRFKGKARAISERDVIEDWNRGKVPVLLAHPQSAGHGLNLQFGGCNMLWTSMADSQQDFSQSVRRLLRPGQGRPVTVSRLAIPGTWDDLAYENVINKRRVEQDLLKHLEMLGGN